MMSKSYEYGQTDFARGMTIKQNPYRGTDPRAKEWARGFIRASLEWDAEQKNKTTTVNNNS
jgi:hypothetical protein